MVNRLLLILFAGVSLFPTHLEASFSRKLSSPAEKKDFRTGSSFKRCTSALSATEAIKLEEVIDCYFLRQEWRYFAKKKEYQHQAGEIENKIKDMTQQASPLINQKLKDIRDKKPINNEDLMAAFREISFAERSNVLPQEVLTEVNLLKSAALLYECQRAISQNPDKSIIYDLLYCYDLQKVSTKSGQSYRKIVLKADKLMLQKLKFIRTQSPVDIRMLNNAYASLSFDSKSNRELSDEIQGEKKLFEEVFSKEVQKLHAEIKKAVKSPTTPDSKILELEDRLRTLEINCIGEFSQLLALADLLSPVTKKIKVYQFLAKCKSFTGDEDMQAFHSRLTDCYDALRLFMSYFGKSKEVENAQQKVEILQSLEKANDLALKRSEKLLKKKPFDLRFITRNYEAFQRAMKYYSKRSIFDQTKAKRYREKFDNEMEKIEAVMTEECHLRLKELRDLAKKRFKRQEFEKFLDFYYQSYTYEHIPEFNEYKALVDKVQKKVEE